MVNLGYKSTVHKMFKISGAYNPEQFLQELLASLNEANKNNQLT